VFRIVTIVSLLLLTGCDFGFLRDEILVGRYRLVAVDIKEQMMMCWSLDDGSCVGDGLPGNTLFAAGFNDKYIVAAVHPESNKDVTQFFYVVRDPRTENEYLGIPYKGIKGPLSESEFETERSRLDLPAFSRVFKDLQ
jgi:hypothetical protein